MPQPPPELIDSRLDLEGRVATLTLGRHDVRNELTGTKLAAEIVEVADWINREEGVSALIITGEGSSFSAGGNVKHMLNREQGSFAGDVYTVQNRYRQGIQRMALAMHRLEVPAIAAVNGPAVGAGFDLACMCDIRLGSTEAKVGETFVNLGIIPGDGGGWLLQRLVGYQRAAEMTFSGRILDAGEALSVGIFLELTEPDTLIPRARELAATFAAKPPRSVRLTKRLLKAAQKMEMPEYLELCAVMQGICHNTEDHLEAVSAFLEKRPPSFQGR
ncbi:enoyl-CoA hydratase-related protein [Limobrevibacterium gyesilva]|uniref:Enoyl-CoA hydratase-related protein n=1 Tax=Limobrevibacterium gyesilva TaxID=2991712 RepID=A0AA42CH07_9PROT|nr:enoyl-CoA hydratase-related protein [Limobrevibacterium gyesilva]MCW3476701.1 enoyl-CoA hydratase-related protein [Limobrevibacterium gyesilva]